MKNKEDRRIADRAEWDRMWQEHWIGPALKKKAVDAEQQLLSSSRSQDVEKKRLARITKEFEMGFRRLHKLGPAVTVLGSARFTEETPQYKLGLELGRALAKAGFCRDHRWWSGIDGSCKSWSEGSRRESIGCNIVLPFE
jgi:uncharacterized protein (TIGR00730 family)